MSNDDVVVWADGTWCFGDELSQMTHLSDDYYVLECGTDEYYEFLAKEGLE